jgi:putative ABC transport system permease protein
MQDYPSYKAELQTSLQILFVPIVLMLAFYIYMVSQLMVTTDKTSISVMESRGAGKGRIVVLYLIEYSLLAFISFIVGPALGLIMCKVLGASNGFLTFVGRTASRYPSVRRL